MTSYRLYFLDDQDHIADATEIEVAGDREALDRAEAQADGRAMELWRLDRVIRKFPAAPGCQSAGECRRKAEALDTLAMMFPERADAYRKAERKWRDLEAKAADLQQRRGRSAP